MIRRRKTRHVVKGPQLGKRETSREAPLVLSNPVNQSAHWSHETYLLSDLVTRFSLPQVVRCANRLVPGEELHLPFNVHVPMLLCSGRSARKLLARHVASDTRSRLTETDDSIVIPHDYDGNFLRLQARTTQDMSASHTLVDIANSHAPAFLNFSPLMSFDIMSSANGHASSSGTDNVYSEVSLTSHVSNRNGKFSGGNGLILNEQKRTMHPSGSVFVVRGTTTGVAKNKRKSRHVVLLRCSDEAGLEVIIPTDQPSEVVQVEVPPKGTSKLSQRPDELMKANRYPGLVRYVYGSHAPRLAPCSKLFTLIDTFEEDSLIGCLLYPNHALMIEIPMTCSLVFQVAMNHHDVMRMPLPRHALGVVQARRDTFMKDLKLKCKFLHRVKQGSAMAEIPGDDDMPSATVRTRQYANEAFFYL